MCKDTHISGIYNIRVSSVITKYMIIKHIGIFNTMASDP